MSGICGIINQAGNVRDEREHLEKMLESLRRRGPDEREIYLKESAGLGVCRLATIDLVSGKQPIFSQRGDIVLICDGEIYNFKKLKSELEKKGCRFRTSSDLEVIVHLYEERGIDFLESLRGVFSLALWDRRKEIFCLARDRIGVKPLYYFNQGNKLIFASLPRAIIAHPEVPRSLDLSSLDCYLTFEYLIGEQSIFKDVKRLLPGHYLVFKKGNLEVKSYWQLNFSIGPVKNELLLKEKILKTLKESVGLNLLADVPLGVLLSGGFDSSTIVALMSQIGQEPIKTFSIGFEDKSYNELNYARLISERFKTEHHELFLSSKTADLARQLIKFLDEPLADTSIIPTFLAFQLAKDYVKVVLCGDGGDELFAGYDTYLAQSLAGRLEWLPGVMKRYLAGIAPRGKKKGMVNRMRRLFEGLNLPSDIKHHRWMINFSPLDKKALYSPFLIQKLNGLDSYRPVRSIFNQAKDLPCPSQLQYVDLRTYLPDAGLVKVDQMSMANSMQARFPFLDNKVVELITGIPPQLRLKRFRTKYILKKTMSEFLPAEIINRHKEGFSSPVKNWLRNEFKPLLLESLSPENIKKRGLFNEGYIQTLIKEHLEKKKDNSHRLWALIVFEIWAQEWLDG